MITCVILGDNNSYLPSSTVDASLCVSQKVAYHQISQKPNACASIIPFNKQERHLSVPLLLRIMTFLSLWNQRITKPKQFPNFSTMSLVITGLWICLRKQIDLVIQMSSMIFFSTVLPKKRTEPNSVFFFEWALFSARWRALGAKFHRWMWKSRLQFESSVLQRSVKHISKY